MSIPIRLWRALRGRIALARERASVSSADLEAALEQAAIAQAESDAVRELAEHSGMGREGDRESRREAGSGVVAPSPRRSVGPSPKAAAQSHDPLAADYALLQLAPGSNLAALDAAYQARLAEVSPERFPEGSPERTQAEARRHAIAASYERLRDAVNTTETRFEKLEF
jgi:hypothetical protein